MLPIRQYIEWDIVRYCRYGWGDSIIQKLIFRRHGIRLSRRCIDAVRRREPCTAYCRANCVLIRHGHSPDTTKEQES